MKRITDLHEYNCLMEILKENLEEKGVMNSISELSENTGRDKCTAEFMIRNGDWKHDHIAVKNAITEALTGKYYAKVEIVDEEPSEEDCYTAYYKINLYEDVA